MLRHLQRQIPVFTILLGVVAMSVAAPSTPALSHASSQRVERLVVPLEIPFREDERGLMTRVWVNGAGPFLFAIDTGAGVTVVSPKVAAEAGLTAGRAVSIAGLSGRVTVARETGQAELAAGDSGNRLPTASSLTISGGLPARVDGLLDPAVALWPLGFELNFNDGWLRAFDPAFSPVRRDAVPEGGAVTTWLMRGESRRPFVALGSGSRALIDTGSTFGFAVDAKAARAFGIEDAGLVKGAAVADIGGGAVTVRRSRVPRVMLGGMLLENVPADVLTGVERGTPILLGRDVLRPFVIAFDPRSRLIRIALR